MFQWSLLNFGGVVPLDDIGSGGGGGGGGAGIEPVEERDTTLGTEVAFTFSVHKVLRLINLLYLISFLMCLLMTV